MYRTQIDTSFTGKKRGINLEVIALDTYAIKTEKTVISGEHYASAKADIIAYINELCEVNGISYFAYSTLLIGVAFYEGLIPGKEAGPSPIGLLRNDYEKLLKLLRNDSGELIFDEYLGDKKVYPQPIVRLGKRFYLDVDGISIERIAWIHIAPFDALPRDFDYRNAHIRHIRRRNETYKRIVGCRTFNRDKQSIIRFAAKFLLYGWTNPRRYYRKTQQIAQKFTGKFEEQYACIIQKLSKIIDADKLFPLQKLPFYGTTILCPNDITPWVILPSEEIERRTVTIQQVDLLLLKEFDRVCREIGVGYFICGGTMLGYCRHGGFIPWDDDVDCGMLRSDYNKFIAEAGKYLDKRFFLQTRATDKHIPYLFSKIRIDGTEYVTNYNENRPFHKGICLDIFPFDAVPNDLKDRERFVSEVKRVEIVHNKVVNRQIPEPVYTDKPKNFSQAFARFKGKVFRTVMKLIPLSYTQKRYIKIATRYNANARELGFDTVASFVPTYTYSKLSDLLPYRDAEFEGIRIMVPNKPEVFLEMQYGDFMSLPMKHQQTSHDLIHWSADVDEINDMDIDAIIQRKRETLRDVEGRLEVTRHEIQQSQEDCFEGERKRQDDSDE